MLMSKDFYLNSSIITVNDSSISITFAFWKMRPVLNIPTRAGSVVRLTIHPPKWAEILRSINWNTLPFGGAACSPMRTYSMHQENKPIRPSATILENCL